MLRLRKLQIETMETKLVWFVGRFSTTSLCTKDLKLSDRLQLWQRCRYIGHFARKVSPVVQQKHRLTSSSFDRRISNSITFKEACYRIPELASVRCLGRYVIFVTVWTSKPRLVYYWARYLCDGHANEMEAAEGFNIRPKAGRPIRYDMASVVLEKRVWETEVWTWQGDLRLG